MCSIVGLISKNNEEVGKKIVKMLQATQHRGHDSAGICVNGKNIIAKELQNIDVSQLKGDIGIGNTRLSIIDDVNGAQPMEGYYDDFFVFNGEIYNFESLREEMDGHAFRFASSSDTEIILRMFEENFKENRLDVAVKKTMGKLDGMYSIAIFLKDKIILLRDPIGIKPLYIVDNKEIFGFSSERKAFWTIGVFSNIAPLNPGAFVIANKNGYKLYKGVELRKKSVINISIENATNHLLSLLYMSIEKRINYPAIGILFSGGLDSSILAKISSDLGAKVVLYCSGVKDSEDVKNAKEVSEILNLPLRISELTYEIIEEYLPKILYSIEESDLMNLAIAIPIFFSTKLAKEEGIRVMLSGQGADEIFGGYKRYERIMLNEGYTKLRKELERDVSNIWAKNLQRDDAASMANAVEVRFPFLDTDFLKYSVGLPPEFKIIKDGAITSRKHILRLIAKEIGLPESIISRPKVAAQFGSSSQKIIEKIAENKGFKKSFSRKFGYGNPAKLYVDILADSMGMPVADYRIIAAKKKISLSHYPSERKKLNIS